MSWWLSVRLQYVGWLAANGEKLGKAGSRRGMVEVVVVVVVVGKWVGGLHSVLSGSW